MTFVELLGLSRLIQQKYITGNGMSKLRLVDSAEPGEIRTKLIETGWEQQKLQL